MSMIPPHKTPSAKLMEKIRCYIATHLLDAAHYATPL